MSIEHVNATDPNIHEPKGASTAGVNTVYVSNGLGSGTWKVIPYALTYTIPDASAASSFFIVCPFAGNITKAYAVVDDLFSMNQNITLTIAGVPVTNGVIGLVASGSAAGDIFNCTPTAANAITAGGALEIVNQGGSASPFSLTLTIIITPP